MHTTANVPMFTDARFIVRTSFPRPKGVMYRLLSVKRPRIFKKITCRPPRSQADLSANGRP